MDKRYGVINEVGDMGLGFDAVSDKDQKTIKETQETNKPKEGNKK